jgi:hypothetical protein
MFSRKSFPGKVRSGGPKEFPEAEPSPGREKAWPFAGKDPDNIVI